MHNGTEIKRGRSDVVMSRTVAERDLAKKRERNKEVLTLLARFVQYSEMS